MKDLNRFIVIIALLVILPLLFMRGMFMDGAMYAAVSLNMAEGIGSFWQPHYSLHFFGLDGFYENPPLGIFSLSLFYRVLGDGFWVERLFIAICLLLSLRGLYLNLEFYTKDPPKLYGFSLLAWMLMPTMFWAFRYNMMEVQLTPLLLFAHWWLLRSLEKRQNIFFTALIFALFNLAAFLIKGPVGIFLMAAPFLYWLIVQREKFIFHFGLLAGALTLGFGFSLLLFEGAAHFFDQYLFVRTAERLANNPTVGSRFWILGELLQQLALPLLLSLILVFIFRKKASLNWGSRKAWYLLAVAVSASLPLMVSLVQRPFYLLTSFPFYAIALSVFVQEPLTLLAQKLSESWQKLFKILSYAGLIALAILLTLTWGDYKRDELLFKDISALKKTLPLEVDQVFVSDEVIYNWSLKAYMMRYERIDLLSIHGFDPERSIFLLSKDHIPNTPHGSFKLVESFDSFKLYRLEKS